MTITPFSTFVTFSSKAPKITVTAPLGAAAPTIIGGYGGVDEIGRRRQKPLTDSDSIPLIKQTIEVLFDAYDRGSTRQSVDDQVAQLETLAGLGRTSSQLPIITLGGHVRYTDLQWHIDQLVPTQVIRADPKAGEAGLGKGSLLRMGFTVTLVECVSPALSGSGPGTGARSYTTKKGDTLKKIAHHFLKDSRKWTQIAKLNGLKKSGGLKVGTRLRIPPK
ncbi:MAG: LysM peptidoglycan-binding domain-containing protein [Thermoleophilaceae bacterium]|nr:LysM peptidoglycan-binding domain-containing protein [Thermoleophilaceae bacterium]